MLTDRSRTDISRNRFGRAALACSTLAIAVALTSAPAHAQFAESFQGNATTTFGSATVTTGPNTTTVTVNSPSAVIDWTPFDTAVSPLAITWQPNGTTATYTSTANFAVLNRIIPVDPTRAIAFDGIVNSVVNSSPGGTVFFYSPGGIILSPNAQFNVGNLGLTSAAPLVDGAGNWYTGNQVQFQASDPGRMVNTLAGSQITAPAEGSFVALVAPSISHRGSIDVNGQAALVSADAATITFSPSGLFDIQVTSGTSATGTTLFSNGTITGPASSGAGDNHRIYAVAVPKNNAIFMAIATGSQLGFNIAGAANMVGNAVVLSGGKDIIGGAVQAQNSPGGGSGLADVTLRNTAITSAITGSASGLVSLFSAAGGTTTTASNVTLAGGVEAEIASLDPGSTTTINGAVNLSAIGVTNIGGADVTAGTTEIFANNNGLVTINGGAFLNSSAFGGGTIAPGGTGGSATGGTSIIQALSGGDVMITGAGQVNANAQGGSNTSTSGGNGGAATGGRAQIFARDAGSSVTIGGIANARANGTGGASGPTGQGGSGTGGIALINAQAAGPATVSIGQAVVIQAVGSGGGGFVGGTGTGGTASAAASEGNTISFGAAVDISAPGLGGAGSQLSGTGTGGTSRFNLFNSGTINVATNATVMANGFSGNTGTGTGTSTGGLATAIAQQNSVLDINGNLQVVTNGVSNPVPGSNGSGGSSIVGATGDSRVDVAGVLRVRANGSAGSGDGLQGSGGNGVGGNAQLFVNTGGDVLANELNVDADGLGGFDTGAGAGSGTGGSASIFAGDPGSTISVAQANTSGMIGTGDQDFLSAEGFGGVSNGGGSGLGGSATGGTAAINVINGATLTGPTSGNFLRIIGRATGGGANTGAIAGGQATGGTINIIIDNATMTTSSILPSSFAQGGNAIASSTGTINGGNAIGGNRNISIINNGTLTTQSPGGSAGAVGGDGNAQGRGGDASGGNASLLVDNNSAFNISAGNFAVFTTNEGGSGLNSGNATGGTAFARIANGSTVTQTGPVGSGFGVSADNTINTPLVAGSGSGGSVTAGTATLIVENATLNVQELTVSASTFSGAPQFYAQGTNATGGVAVLELNGATVNAQAVFVSANGLGGSLEVGQSGIAGTGTGGDARLRSFAGNSTLTSTTGVTVSAAGVGGDIGGAAGTTTGSGIGGLARIIANAPGSMTITAPTISVDADGEGGEVFSGVADFGGDGTGGIAEVIANQGNLTIVGDLFAEADNDGGEGLVGGDAVRRTDGAANVALRAQDGTLTVTGTTSLSSLGEGDGGGSATGGFISIDAQSNVAGSGRINFNGDVIANASAEGGDGAAAASPTLPGGDGGDASGGTINVFGSAGNGNLVINGTTTFNASASGGAGGTGHSGATGTAGGVGGNAQGGFVIFGTRSGPETGAINSGSAQFGTVTVNTDGFGGLGGEGGTGTTPGVGGVGGDGFGGGVSLIVRGSSVILDDMVATANGIGGNGGVGSVEGDGGDGYAGEASVAVTQRFMRTERGVLTANDISIISGGFGGAGATPGDSFYSLARGPESEFFVRQSDVTLGNLTLGTTGDLAPDRTVMGLEAGPGGTAGQVPVIINITSEPFDLSVTDGTVNVSGALSLFTPGEMRVSLDNSTLDVANLSLQASNFVLPAIRPATLGTITVSDNLSIGTSQDLLVYANLVAPFSVDFSVDGDFLTGDLTIDGDVEIASEGTITTGAVDSNGTIDFVAGGAITTGALKASDSVFANSGGVLSVGAVSAGTVDPLTPPFDGYTIGLRGGTSLTAGNLSALGNIGLSSPGSISIGSAFANSIILALPGTGFTSGALSTTATSGGRIYIANNSMESLGGMVGPGFNPAPILAASQVQVNGPIAINGSVSTGILQANALQALGVTGPITARQSSVLVGGSSITTSDVTVGNQAIFASGGAIVLGNVDAGLAIPTSVSKIAIGSTAGPVTTGNLASGQDLGIQTGGSIGTGNLRGRDVLLLAGGAVLTGAITAVAGSQSQFLQAGRVFIGNFSMATPQANVFTPFFGPTGGSLSIFNSFDPTPTGGAITINGAVQARSLFAATAQNFNATAITISSSEQSFNEMFIGAGGLITVNAPWRADFMQLRSNDIDITTTGTLTGFVELISTNQTMAVIGDISSTGATQPGSGAYRLTDAEFDRISGGFSFGARDNTGEVDLLVGDLSVDATRFTTEESGEIFVYSDEDSDEDFVGRIRVDGNVTVTGATSSASDGEAFRIEFDAKSFELNAATGSVTIAGANGALAGAIEIEAENIHVASDEILLKLRADPRYEGSVQELNAPAAVQRPDGVLRANILQLEGEDTIYIQNTGSSAVPAGFVTRVGNETDEDDGTSIGPEDDEDRSSTDTFRIVINGQVQTDTGLVTGKAAFDQIITAARSDLDPGEEFAVGLDPESTLNSCNIISGACAFGSSDPVASISSEVKLAIINQLGDAPVPDVIEEAADAATESADEEAAQSSEEEDEAEADEASSPIAPPTPLINTRPLNPAVSVVEPVAGAGNPALIGSAVNEATAQGDTP